MTVKAPSSEDPAKAVEADQVSSSGDDPEQEPVSQQPAHQPDQQLDPLGGLPCTQEDGNGTGQEQMDEEGTILWEDDPDDDEMSSALQDKQSKLTARKEKAQQTKTILAQKVPKALAGRTSKPHRKAVVKTTG